MPRPKPLSNEISSTEALAKRLKLSRATVSRALNNDPRVHPETRERVMEAMRSHGFFPNQFARSLAGRASGTIGICLRELLIPVMSEKLSLLQEALRLAGFRSLIQISNNQPENEEEAIRHLLSMRVDGVVFLDPILSDGLQLLRKRGIPTVLLDPIESTVHPHVELDRELAMEMLMEHLWGMGHRRFGLLVKAEERARPLKGILSRYNLVLGRQMQSFGKGISFGGGIEEGAVAADCALAARIRPTALIGLNDLVAVGALMRLRKRGVRVPEEISVTGFDNLPLGNHFDPRLTTVDQQIRPIVETAIRLLQDQIAGKTVVRRTLIPPQLVIRESTGIVRSQ